MRVKCLKCGKLYDDVYRWTFCPHARFDMHTVVVHNGRTHVVTSIEKLNRILKEGR